MQKHNKNRSYLLAVLCILIVASVLVFYFYPTSDPNKLSEQKEKGVNEKKQNATETKNVIFLVLDGVGSKYLQSFDPTPLSYNGVSVEKAELQNFFGLASAFAEVEQPFPETTSAHSLYYIAGDCGREWGNIKECVDDGGLTTICDFYRSQGYVCIMVSEAGDFKEARSEFDVVLYDYNFWDFQVELNSNSKEASEIASFLEKRKILADSKKSEAGLDGNSYIEYSNFIIETDALLISFIKENLPYAKFFLFSNAKGTDLCGHRLGVESYVACIEGLNLELQKLALLRDENTALFVTADHGMAFDCLTCKGYHAKDQKSSFAIQIPLIFVGTEKFHLHNGTAYDIMPTVFSVSGFDYACSSMRYCKGSSLVVRGEGS
ncbi:MAG: hypothetical protein QW400_04355 [Candidatus Diapherotrites archaeon]